MAPDEDFAALFCGCLGSNILDAIDLTEGPMEAFTRSATGGTGKEGKDDVATPVTANGDLDGFGLDDDDISTGSQSTCNDITSKSVKFTTQHPPAEVISIYPTYSVNPERISVENAQTAATAAALAATPRSLRRNKKKGMTKPIRAKQIVPPGQEDTYSGSKMMRNLENSFLSMQVELLHGLSSPPGILDDRIKKRRLQREKQRLQEEERLKRKLEREERLQKQQKDEGSGSAGPASGGAARTNPEGTPTDVSPICEAPTVDLSDEEDMDPAAEGGTAATRRNSRKILTAAAR
mmetsp:Transcript_54672/g.132775  ORF Transcript_54672/g.132775 Transcript_54672/m.132775 type:complete len:293 (-) Transcript_54672:280-1158(-)|eukprot:CAMPEP_0113456372 /NCGR_PEP_ID=MMETSP0014_2-20120614/8852_1 /TAXON_ID=2857 /ORGANISM="Nitzschia sp." /LENGTH=292 /DNA_ID=CAMNT_0000347821 /DNA_START=219 /DNA_END=1097 /DNA_ORIENTATION=- /assembly_acc=CAM_ASM_000159